jgi:uncharacterized membrane protein (UPF0127 family)
MKKDNLYEIILFANNNNSRTKGLMNTEPLEKNQCAVFVFPRVSDHSFWNHNVAYPLKLYFCNSLQKIVAIKTMEAMSKKQCKADNFSVKYVIETYVNSDDGEVGDTIIIDINKMRLKFVSTTR